jgi:flagellin
MLGINTNLYALDAHERMRQLNLEFSQRTERMASGLRINRGQDDPSGLAISKGMQAQVNGLLVNMHNIQDGINLIRYVDGYLDDIQNVLLNIRDLSVRMSNQAALSVHPGQNANDLIPSDMNRLYKEILTMGYHLWVMTRDEDEFFNKVKPFAEFGEKPVFNDSFEFGECLQVGPDADSTHRIEIFIDDIRQTFTDFFLGVGVPPWDNINGLMDADGYLNQAKSLLTLSDDKLNIISDIRARLGVQDRQLQHTLQDIQAQYINIAAGKSRVEDADFADEITGLSRNQILNQSAQAAAAQANVQPLAVIDLLDAIYDGLSPELAKQAVSQAGGG